MTQLETAMFSDWPPPKRNTDQRVLNVQFATVTYLLLPNSAQASSWHAMLQFEILTCSLLLKWNPSLFKFTRLWIRTPSRRTYLHSRIRAQWYALAVRKMSRTSTLRQR